MTSPMVDDGVDVALQRLLTPPLYAHRAGAHGGLT